VICDPKFGRRADGHSERRPKNDLVQPFGLSLSHGRLFGVPINEIGYAA
jgi:hypothetical protein